MSGIGWLIVEKFLFAYYAVAQSAVLQFLVLTAVSFPVEGEAEVVVDSPSTVRPSRFPGVSQGQG